MRSAEEVAFWLAVNVAPNDPRPKLILADWLMEHGRDHEAEALRWAAGIGLRLIPGAPYPFPVMPRNIDRAVAFLFDDERPATAASVWQGICTAWAFCRRAGVNPCGEYYAERFRRQRLAWHNDSHLAIVFALARLPEGATAKEKRKAVSAAYPFGQRAHHPYKVWLGAVRQHLGTRRALPPDSGAGLFAEPARA